MLVAQIISLRDSPGWLTKLHDPSCEFEALGRGARLSRGMRWMSCEIVCGNPVFVGDGSQVLILVVACFAVDGRFGVIGHQCSQAQCGPFSSEWLVQPSIGKRLLEESEGIRSARNWRFSADRGRLFVLR